MAQNGLQAQSYVTSLAAKLENSAGPVYSLDWSPDNHFIGAAGYSQFRIWDAISCKEVTTISGHTSFVWGLAWSPDGRTLASAGADGFVRWWDAATWQKMGEQEAAWSPDGRLLGVGLWNGSLVLWDGVSGKAQMTLTATTERSDVNGLACSPNGKLLATTHQDGRLRVWDPGTGSIVKTLESRVGWLRGVTWSPDGRLLAAAGEAAEVYVWRYDSGDRLACLSPDCRLPAWSLKWSPDGKYLAVGDGIYETAPIGGKVIIYQMPGEAPLDGNSFS